MSHDEIAAMEKAAPCAEETRVMRELGDHAHRLRNGSKDDQGELVASIATLIDSQKWQHERMVRLPDRDEVRSMISAHSTQCAAARADSSSFTFGKGGLKASGRVATFVVVGLAIVFMVVSPHIGEWIKAWKSVPAAAQEPSK